MRLYFVAKLGKNLLQMDLLQDPTVIGVEVGGNADIIVRTLMAAVDAISITIFIYTLTE